MSKFRILLCEDEENKVEGLKSCLGEDLFAFDSVSQPDLVSSHIESNGVPDALFVDLYYRDRGDPDSEPHAVDFDWLSGIRRLVGPAVPVVVFTQYTHRQVELLQRASFSRVIDEWITLDDVQRTESRDGTVVRLHRLFGFVGDGADQLWLMHLSDLHFGRQFRHAGRDVGDSLHHLLLDQLRESVESTDLGIQAPQVLVVSGDLTNTSVPSELDKARRFVESMRDGLASIGGHPVPVVLVPGNHDLNWELSIPEVHTLDWSKDPLVVVEREGLGPEWLSHTKWSLFSGVFSRFLGRANRQSDMRWWIYDMVATLGVRFFGYNTSFGHTYSRQPVSVLAAHVDEMADAIDDPGAALGIWVGHHPTSMWGDERDTKEIMDLMRRRLGVRLVISGHRHANSIKRHPLSGAQHMAEAQSGSVSVSGKQRDENEGPTYRVLQLQRPDLRAWTALNAWTFTYSAGIYKPEPVDGTGKFIDEYQL